MVQVKTKRVALYCRVSTDHDQSTDRQERDLREYASRCGYEIVDVFCETASGSKNDRAERAKVLELARKRKIDAILITELSRWGRSTEDLLSTLNQLIEYNVGLVDYSGSLPDPTTPAGKMITTVLAAISEFERAMIIERTKSGVAAARAKGVKFGRPEGKTSDKHRDAVLSLIQAGRTYREIAAELAISKTTVVELVKRHG